MGRLDVIGHSKTKVHRDIAVQMKAQQSLNFSTSADVSTSLKTIEAEL